MPTTSLYRRIISVAESGNATGLLPPLSRQPDRAVTITTSSIDAAIPPNGASLAVNPTTMMV
jgi:hypothetical protein